MLTVLKFMQKQHCGLIVTEYNVVLTDCNIYCKIYLVNYLNMGIPLNITVLYKSL
jgi:hypothetical protein